MALTDSLPTLQDNWTTQETTTYNPALPADAPVAWGGTVANLDRDLTATGSTRTALGALLTFVQKPNFFAGVIIKVQASFALGSSCAIEVWVKVGSAWTKERRVGIAGIARSGESFILDLTAPILPAQSCDAMWITLAQDLGTEALTWTVLHVYGICNNDPVTPDCPPGTAPEDCDAPECGVDFEDWVCIDPADPTTQDPTEPPTPPEDPFTLPPILVQIPNPTTYTLNPSGTTYFHTCPRPTLLQMYFGDLPGGGSVVVTVANAHGVTFVEGITQAISAPGVMTWTVLTGFLPGNVNADPSLPPAPLTPTTDFYFTRDLAGSVFFVAGNLLDILNFWWTYNVGYQEVC